MKQLITIFYITFLLGITNLQAQNYIPMAVDSAVWLIGHSPDIAGNYTTYTMEFTNGDTIVNNVHYYKCMLCICMLLQLPLKQQFV